jgi:radical SAM/Cys-rich protein
MGANVNETETVRGVGMEPAGVEPFSATLARHGIGLRRGKTTILQVNLGLFCNQLCKHCHLEAGPHRAEIMSLDTMRQVQEFAARGDYQVVDITGGAPEMNPNLKTFIEHITGSSPLVMLRSNLTALAEGNHEELLALCVRKRLVIVASLPSVNASQMEAQRGHGAWETSVASLRRLNSLGYGQADSGLELNLVSNPTGAFLPVAQKQTEKKFRTDLQRKYGIVFNNLFAFANAPLGRFRRWLSASGNLDQYIRKLALSFNPCTAQKLMCQSLVSVSWDGYLYDCDFNLARQLPLGGLRHHVSDMPGPPDPGTPIVVSDHCYACTAGSGFT